jgi:WD40 repeat protein
LAWSNDSTRIVARSKQDVTSQEEEKDREEERNELCVYDVTSGKPLRSWTVTANQGTAVAFALGGETVVRADEDGTLHLLVLGTGQELARWQAHDSAITAVAVSPDGNLLVSGDRGGTVRVWNLPWIRSELRKLGLDW